MSYPAFVRFFNSCETFMWKYTVSGINEVHCGFTYIPGIIKMFFLWCGAEGDAALNKVFAFDNLQLISFKKCLGIRKLSFLGMFA